MAKGAGIAAPKYRDTLTYPDGRTPDIMEEVLSAIRDGAASQTREFSRQFENSYSGLSDLWDFVKTNIRYIEDPGGVQWVKEPARLWADRSGDCKSFTVFIVSVLQNLGIPCVVRFVSFSEPRGVYTHVYPVAKLDGREVPVDAVWTSFDSEKRYLRKKDYPMARIYRLSGTGESVSTDITEMTQGELDRYQSARLIAAHAEHEPNPAIRAAMLADAKALLAGRGGSQQIQEYLDATARATGAAYEFPAEIGSLKSKVKDAANAVKDAFKKALKALANNLVKKMLPAAGPVFLYLFITKKVGGKTAVKKAKIEKAFKAIVKLTGIKESTAMAAIQEGIVKKMGKTPAALIAEAAAKKVSGPSIGWITAVLAVLPLFVQLVQAILKVTGKKSDFPDLKEEDMPDFDELVADLGGGTTKGGSPSQTDPVPADTGIDDDDDEPNPTPTKSGDSYVVPLLVGAGVLYFIIK